MAEYVLETKNLTKKYGSHEVVKSISLHIPKGSIYGLIGKNGAGKSTFMKMICGIANPTNGEIYLFGNKNKEKEISGQDRIGSLIENPGIYGNMSVYENLKIKAVAMGVFHEERIREIIELVGLSEAKKKKVKKYSTGMKQRLGIALALIGSPDFLILDEPINGLDPQGIAEMRCLIERLSLERKMTILISSHILEELYKVVTHIGIIHEGELIFELTKEELDHRCEKKIKIVTSEVAKASSCLEKIGINQYTIYSNDTIFIYNCNSCIQEINKALIMADIPVNEVCVQNDNLEEFFLQITEGSMKS